MANFLPNDPMKRNRLLQNSLLAIVPLSVLVLIGLWLRSRNHAGVVIEGATYQLLERVQTGHQRAERVAFLEGGRFLAVTCPRYDRVVIYQVDPSTQKLQKVIDRKLPGKPVALAETPRGLLVLQRPAGDDRHIMPGFCQLISIKGEPIGDSWPVGYDPDDLVVSAHGKHAYVLLSGNAEGESNRPDPELVTFELSQNQSPIAISNIRLGGPTTDPLRIYLSARQTHAAVLARDGNLHAIDLSNPREPQLSGRLSLLGKPRPALSASENDVIVVPAESLSEVAPMAEKPQAENRTWQTLVTLEADSGQLVFYGTHSPEVLGRLTLHGPAGIGQVRLCGLAYSPERELIAVADRSGGLHLLGRTQAGAVTKNKYGPAVSQRSKTQLTMHDTETLRAKIK